MDSVVVLGQQRDKSAAPNGDFDPRRFQGPFEVLIHQDRKQFFGSAGVERCSHYD
jgi:hypothetical protein